MIHLFYGHEDRLDVGSTVFMHSVLRWSTTPVAMTPISRLNCPVGKEGSNAFTFSRFLVPWLMGYTSWAIFADGSDMLLRGDIAELARLYNPFSAVQVVKRTYSTKHPRKFVGTTMETDNQDYPRKQWASLMLINCNHFAWRDVNPNTIGKFSPLELLQLQFIPDRYIVDLPKIWNWIVDEDGPNPEAKLLHWTAGIPILPHYQDSPMGDEWMETLTKANQYRA